MLRPLDPTTNAGIAQRIATGEGLFPLDPTRGSALQELTKNTSIIDTFIRGGPIMWPNLVCSIIALAVSIERIVFFFWQKPRRRTADIDAIYELPKTGPSPREWLWAKNRGILWRVCSVTAAGFAEKQENRAWSSMRMAVRNTKRSSP